MFNKDEEFKENQSSFQGFSKDGIFKIFVKPWHIYFCIIVFFRNLAKAYVISFRARCENFDNLCNPT